MSTYFLRVAIGFFTIGSAIWIVYPLSQWHIISIDGQMTTSYIYASFLCLSLLYLLVVYALMQQHHARQKTTLLVLWLAYIYLWYMVLVNDPTTYIYTGDVVRLAGAMIILFGATWVAIPAWVQTQKIEKNLEIIEV